MLIRGLWFVGLIGYGLYLSNFWLPASTPNSEDYLYRMLGWFLVAYGLVNWKSILLGFASFGKLMLFFLLVAALAAAFGGETKLWETFF